MRFTKMILAMSLAFAFSASHAASNKIEFAEKTDQTELSGSPQDTQPECETPKNLPDNYQYVQCISNNGWLRFRDATQSKSNDTGIMDTQGKVILPAEYFGVWEMEHHKNWVAVARKSNEKSEWALLDEKLQWVLPFAEQDFHTQENSPIIRVERKQNGEEIYALFDSKTRQFITPFKYTFLREFSKDGMAGFSTAPLYKYGKYDENYPIGFLNEKGEEVIPEIYTQAGIFTEGVNWVQDKDGDRWLIDKTGKKLWKLPYHYTVLSTSNKGLIGVDDRFGRQAMIDHSGKEIVPFGKFDSFGHSDNLPVLFVQKGNSQAGLLDLKGNELLPLSEYDRAEDASDEDKNDKQSVVFVKDFQISHYDENGKLLKTRTSPYAKTCAHVKEGMKHRHFPAYVVSNAAMAYRNHVVFSGEFLSELEGTCDDVAKPAAKKSAKSKQKRKK